MLVHFNKKDRATSSEIMESVELTAIPRVGEMVHLPEIGLAHVKIVFWKYEYNQDVIKLNYVSIDLS